MVRVAAIGMSETGWGTCSATVTPHQVRVAAIGMSEADWGTCNATVTPHQVRVAAVVMAHKKQVQVSVLSQI